MDPTYKFRRGVIGELLYERGLATARRIADDLGVTEGTVSRWKRGDREPSASQLINLMRHYNLTVADVSEEA